MKHEASPLCSSVVAAPGEGPAWDEASGRLIRADLTGIMLEQIPADCPHTSSCGTGPGGTPYVTTSQLGLDEPSQAAAPLSGILLTHTP